MWLSPGLPADRSELAASLPSGCSLAPPNFYAGANDPPDFGVLPVGSLCIATVFETELLAALAHRPAGVGLLIIGPTPAAGVTQASSVGELVHAIEQTTGHATAYPPAALPTAEPPIAAVPVTGAVAAAGARTPLRTRLIAAGAVLLGLGIGGIVIGTTEGTSSATANGGGGGVRPGGFGPGGFGNGGAQAPGGTGTLPGAPGGQTGGQAGGNAGTFQQELLTCLRQQGVTGSVNQLRLNASDPKLQQAFLTCIQRLRSGSSQITGRP